MSTITTPHSKHIQAFNTLFLSFFTTVFLLLISFILIKKLSLSYLMLSQITPQKIQSLFLPQYIYAAHPKPQERLLWTSFLLLIPVFSFLSLRLWTNRFVESKISEHSQIIHKFFCIVASILFIGAFVPSDFIYFTNFRLITHFFSLSDKLMWILLAGIFTLTATTAVYYSNFSRQIKKSILIFITIICFLIPFFSFRIANIYNINQDARWIVHFDAFFYCVAQVIIGGKTLLADIVSQYGLYPEFLNPIFKMIPLNIFNFTLLMGFLEFAGFFCVILVLNKIIKNKIIMLLYLLFLSWVSGETWLAMVYNHLKWEPYFQYWPLRFLFPALAIYFFYFLIKNTNKKTITLMSAFGAMAALWNLDSGVPVIGAFWIYLLMRIFFPQNDTRQKRLLYLLLSFVTTILCWSLFILYLHIKSGETIHILSLVKYQVIFSIYGFNMLPVPLKHHPWMVFYSAYILGLIIALFSWIKKQTSPVNDLLFFMSILGFGLFTYYQGRAHEFNLIIIAWLPVMIMLILSDRLIRIVKAKMLPKIAYLISTPVIMLTALIGFSFILEIPDLVSKSKKTISTMRNHPQTPVLTNIQFIKKSLNQSKYAVILSTNQGAYYAETGVISPVNTASLVETLLKSDYQNLIDQLTLHPVQHLFIQTEKNNQIPTEFKALLRHYRIEGESKAGMLYLTNKKAN